jgi:hypothetical protein
MIAGIITITAGCENLPKNPRIAPAPPKFRAVPLKVAIFPVEGRDVGLNSMLTEIAYVAASSASGVVTTSRIDMERLARERSFQHSYSFDERMTYEVGRVLGADFLMIVSYVPIGVTALAWLIPPQYDDYPGAYISVRLIEVANGNVVSAESVDIAYDLPRREEAIRQTFINALHRLP